MRPRSSAFASPAAVALLAGLFCVLGAWFLHQSLDRPLDWIGRWSMESEKTDDRAYGHARMAWGAGFVEGKMGRGLSLKAPSATAVLDGWIGHNEFAVELWVYPEKLPSARMLIAHFNAGADQIAVVAEAGALAAVFQPATGRGETIRSSFRLKPHAWTHLALSCDRKLLRLFANGSEIASGVIAGFKGGGGGLALGKGFEGPGPWDAPHNFFGLIDETAAYPRALSQAEVKQLYRASSGSPLARRIAADVLAGLAAGLFACALGFATIWKKADQKQTWDAVRRYGVAAAFLSIGLTLSTAAFLYLSREVAELEGNRLDQIVAEFYGDLDTRTELYIQHLMKLRDWLSVQPSVTPQNWSRYLTDAQLSIECPGLFSVGFVETVFPGQTEAHEERWKQIHPGYQLHPKIPVPERPWVMELLPKDAQPQFPLVLHEFVEFKSPSRGRPHPTYGRDFTATKPELFCQPYPESMLAYAINHRTVGAAVVELDPLGEEDQSKAPLYGSRVFMPVFSTQAGEGSPDEFLRGVLFASFNWGAFFESAFRGQAPSFQFRIQSMSSPSELTDVFNSATRLAYGGESLPGLERRRTIRFYRNRLYVDFSAKTDFALPSERRWPWLAGGTGVVLSLLSAGLLSIQIRARIKEERYSQELRDSRDKLALALKDRERISRDLHDGSIQSIYAIGLGLARCRKLIQKDPGRASTQLEQSLSDLNLVISELRQFLLTLEPEVLRGQKLNVVLQSLMDRMQATTEGALVLRAEEEVASKLDPRQSIHLVNIVRESISNSLRHGQASEVLVHLKRANGRLQLEVRDDGQGFDRTSIAEDGRGLRNIADRTKELGGTLNINSAPGRGTSLLVEIPIEEK